MNTICPLSSLCLGSWRGVHKYLVVLRVECSTVIDESWSLNTIGGSTFNPVKNKHVSGSVECSKPGAELNSVKVIQLTSYQWSGRFIPNYTADEDTSVSETYVLVSWITFTLISLSPWLRALYAPGTMYNS